MTTWPRWGEAKKLRWTELLPAKALYEGENTKIGKSRAAPIADNVLSQIKAVVNPAPGRLFNPCRDAFRSAYKRAGFQIPQQMSHILRHGFASHYMMNGGDILFLQRTLGHGNSTITIRYFHLSPDYVLYVVALCSSNSLV
ncbi:tyrosine-type recombinase/integrase [Alcanivorax sp. IL2]|uniref:tyrosine-type recombinase/integrase n=1 Tax=Alcanivorax sp. IL2 TaxID=3396310 RepID=UPI0039C11DC5